MGRFFYTYSRPHSNIPWSYRILFSISNLDPKPTYANRLAIGAPSLRRNSSARERRLLSSSHDQKRVTSRSQPSLFNEKDAFKCYNRLVMIYLVNRSLRNYPARKFNSNAREEAIEEQANERKRLRNDLKIYEGNRKWRIARCLGNRFSH